MKDLEKLLNPEQLEAVRHTEGPLLILAGAGSGKTRVLTYRAAYLIEETGVNPWNIMAITFTNKAAGEMKERIDDIVGFGSESIWVATFHASCARILRRFADRLDVSADRGGYDTHFSIMDADDSKSVMKNVIKTHQLETNDLKLRDFLNAVSRLKDSLVTPAMYEAEAGSDPKKIRILKAYREYQRALINDNAFDFDDLLMRAVELLKKDEEVREHYQQRFRYIMVDEYQDTNRAQFEFVRLLADAHKNLCVVGDDDQSIYRFRGADIRNILDFESVYPDAKIVKLERNYRSTGIILNAANNVIANNIGRRKKRLWTETEGGEQIHFKLLETAYDEALFIAGDTARRAKADGLRYRDIAVLYRTNAQSRLLEEAFVRESIPYDIVGGVNFYSRREIKDILAYLKTIDNGRDDLSVTRIINVPKRGIGAATVTKVSSYASTYNLSFYDAISHATGIVSGKALEKLRGFERLIGILKTIAAEVTVSELIKKIIEQVDYEAYLRELCDNDAVDRDEFEERMSNIDELISKAVAYEDSVEAPTLSGFLEDVALVADIDRVDEDADRVLLMTLHGAKGLEFTNVYIAGMEEDLFPSYGAIADFDEHNSEMEEERRLAYVGITRAKRVLTLTSARSRMVRGETRYHDVSRFVKEIPKDLLDSPPKAARRVEDYLFDGGETISDDDSFSFGVRKKPKPAVSRAAGKSALSYLNKGVPEFDKPDYGVGDRVRHIKFGEGVVSAIEGGGRDCKVTVMFDNGGQRIMQAVFARLVKI